jgi:hypothetical protein
MRSSAISVDSTTWEPPERISPTALPKDVEALDIAQRARIHIRAIRNVVPKQPLLENKRRTERSLPQRDKRVGSRAAIT